MNRFDNRRRDLMRARILFVLAALFCFLFIAGKADATGEKSPPIKAEPEESPMVSAKTGNQGSEDPAKTPEAGHGQGGDGHIELGEVLPLWSCIPFACMLLSIALLPLFMPEFWHHHFGKVSAFWTASLVIPFVVKFKGIAFYGIIHIILADY